MWAVWVLTVMIALSGFYIVKNEISSPAEVITKSYDLVHSMATYEAAVEAYAHANPTFSGTAPNASLNLPSWYVFPSSPTWTNFISAPIASGGTGRIIVYAATDMPISIASDLAVYSKYSRLVGIANTVTGRIDVLGINDTNIPLPTEVVIPNGRPVWIAYRN